MNLKLLLPRWNLNGITEELEEAKKEQNRCKTMYERLCSSVEAAEDSIDPRFAVLKQQADAQKECWSYYVDREKELEMVRSALEIIEGMAEVTESNNASEYSSDGYGGKDPRLIMLEWNSKVVSQKLEEKREWLHICKNYLELLTDKYEIIRASVASAKGDEPQTRENQTESMDIDELIEEGKLINDIVEDEMRKKHNLEYEIDALESYHFVLKQELSDTADTGRNTFFNPEDADDSDRMVVRPISDTKRNGYIPGTIAYNVHRKLLSEQVDKLRVFEEELSLEGNHNSDGKEAGTVLQNEKMSEFNTPETGRLLRKILVEQENKIKSLEDKMR